MSPHKTIANIDVIEHERGNSHLIIGHVNHVWLDERHIASDRANGAVGGVAAGVAEEGVATSSLARRRRGFREAEGGSDKGEGDLRETHRCLQVISKAMVV